MLDINVKPLLIITSRNYERLSYYHTKILFKMAKISSCPSVGFKHSYYHKKINKKNQPFEEEEEDSSDEDEDEDEELDEMDSDIKTVTIKSLRIDLILQKCLGISRSKVQYSFYENRLRKNGLLVLKKAAEARMGDEIDLIKRDSHEKSNLLIVSRVKLISIKGDLEKQAFIVKAEVLKSLTIENYTGRNKWIKQSEPEPS